MFHYKYTSQVVYSFVSYEYFDNMYFCYLEMECNGEISWFIWVVVFCIFFQAMTGFIYDSCSIIWYCVSNCSTLSLGDYSVMMVYWWHCPKIYNNTYSSLSTMNISFFNTGLNIKWFNYCIIK
jgi:hypothetical protein